MLVFDVTNERSFHNIKQWLKTIDTVCMHSMHVKCDVFIILHVPKHYYKVLF